MSAEDSKAVGRRWFAALNAGDLDAAVALLEPTFVTHFVGLPEPVRGPEAWKRVFSGYASAFPTMQITVAHEIAEGDMLAAQWTCRATHTGAFMGIPPTGKQVVGTGMGLFRITGGKIAEEWVQEDSFGLLQQLGAIPAPEQGRA
jgi:steroid delta-isomerase-like uncharacterized protein